MPKARVLCDSHQHASSICDCILRVFTQTTHGRKIVVVDDESEPAEIFKRLVTTGEPRIRTVAMVGPLCVAGKINTGRFIGVTDYHTLPLYHFVAHDSGGAMSVTSLHS